MNKHAFCSEVIDIIVDNHIHNETNSIEANPFPYIGLLIGLKSKNNLDSFYKLQQYIDQYYETYKTEDPLKHEFYDKMYKSLKSIIN